MNDRIDIYSFSGTGNTELMVTRLSEILRGNGNKVAVLPLEKGFKEANENADMIGFAFPASCQAVSPPCGSSSRNSRRTKGPRLLSSLP